MELFNSTARFYTQGTSSKRLFKGTFFNAATSKQPVAKRANRDPAAAHKVATQSERELLFLLITGEIWYPSTDFVVSRAGVAWFTAHTSRERKKNSRRRQPNYPLRNTLVVGLLDYCVSTLCHSCCMLLLLLTVACRTNLYRSNASFEISRVVGWWTEILAQQDGKGYLF